MVCVMAIGRRRGSVFQVMLSEPLLSLITPIIYKLPLFFFLTALRDQGAITSLIVAESRPEAEGAEKKYVQDALKEAAIAKGPLREALLCPTGRIYICGSSKMGDGVHKALVDVYASLWHIKTAEVEKALAEMRENGRYVREVWH